MNKRILTLALAAGMLLAFASCDLLNRTTPPTALPTEAPSTTEATTTAEETTTVSETTTAEETTAEETTTEETTTEAPTPTATPKPTKVPTKKPSAKPTYIPKGWYKVKAAWGKKYKGKKVYVISRYSQYKGWYNGKWIKLYDEIFTVEDNEEYHVDGIQLFRDKKQKKMYYEFTERT